MPKTTVKPAPKAAPRSSRKRAPTALAPEPTIITPVEAPRASATKLDTLVSLLSRADGANIAELSAATAWQPHSVRGAIAGTLKKKRGLPITAVTADGVRRYRIDGAAA